MTTSPEKGTRKRGRPPITKNYANPLESPLAQSSMKVQRQGTHVFSKPMMKVGQLTPNSKKRRNSNAGRLHSESNSHSNSPLKGGLAGSSPSKNNMVKKMGTTKNGRYRGIILATPDKTELQSTNSPSRDKNTLNDMSKPKLLPNCAPLTPITDKPEIMNVMSEKKNEHCINFSLSLNINSNGKATIGSSPNDLSKPEQLHQIKDFISPIKKEHHQITNFQKKDVLFLLKKMKTHASNKYKKSTISKDSITKAKILSLPKKGPLKLEKAFSSGPAINESGSSSKDRISDPKALIPCTPPAPGPMSPGNFFSSQWKTGLTPNINGSLGILSPFRMSLGNSHTVSVAPQPLNIKVNEGIHNGIDEQFISVKTYNGMSKIEPLDDGIKKSSGEGTKQYGFKYFVGDPLLLNDESEIGEQVWQENINMRTNVLSPEHTKVFNTPPSFVNFGSPGSLLFSPPTQRRNSSILAVNNVDSMEQHAHITMLKNHQQKINSSGKIGNSALKLPAYKSPVVPITLKNKQNKSGIELPMLDVAHYELREIGPPGNFQANNPPSEDLPPLMPHSVNTINKRQQLNSIHEIDYASKARIDKNLKVPDFSDSNPDKMDDAGMALKNLIKDDKSISDQV
ncbi:similar to Saccharomyces cerevisiae YOR066W MSA1 Activator of G1-specific transcription factors, MBF and SBF [Maudiozyma barnettii]|uniref:Similar to Saccharomyces cerevisiae YOR066W MSA1 Activator of G1-specific transcription factors, MBF and SBF n=1 Tax=Maudiozyma barnettii TaxID=61262 RepID=A0A8H2VJ12_9SACH|nr:Msa1p [Kazachstania barnettii]CAB4256270.1 similar to Saccharomyces cerevisiae YOR066W MSA1 Activator of G1-specific transcription factors, MBF and SBF [Kazachstania barnettii]CAD1784879.1 similar to Saccharomyces cerevisiae YOR066W MSA1 Activator of G1-specific transcription factors, MBF and SBF [Kazachstania barnettii]